jgi:hypothetical protein
VEAAPEVGGPVKGARPAYACARLRCAFAVALDPRPLEVAMMYLRQYPF